MTDHGRRHEGSLLLFALLILFSGSILVYLAKPRDGIPADAVNLNSATMGQVAELFHIDSAVASKVIEARDRLGRFEYARQPADIRVLSQVKAESAVRTLSDKHLNLNEASSGEI